MTRFRGHYRKATKEMKAAFSQMLELFLADPNHPTLRNHPLKEQFAGYRSVDVTEDVRAIFKETATGRQTIITFHLLGTHADLYG